MGEEGGASMMVKEGALENPRPDCMFAVHSSPYPVGELLYTPKEAMAASELIKITVHGMGVHGSTPWMGKDPMPVAAEIILALAQIYRQIPATEAVTVSIGKVIDQVRFPLRRFFEQSKKLLRPLSITCAPPTNRAASMSLATTLSC